MAKKPPSTLRVADLTDAVGAVAITGLTKSRVHQLAAGGQLVAYIFVDGELVIAEGEERRGRITFFNRYDLVPFRESDARKGGRPRKSVSVSLSPSE